MYQLAKRRSKQGSRGCGDPKPRLIETDIECLKEQESHLANRLGFPQIGARLTNEFGIKWVIEGYTTTTSVATLGHDPDLAAQENLYPISVPQNLSEPLNRILEDLNLCTPKDFVPLDTIPHLRRNLAAPHAHSVDALSDPDRILLFLDSARLHEAALAHELGHVWIDLVDGIEDYRGYRDLGDVVRYTQVEHLQSFVLDVLVNRFLRKRHIDITPIENDRRIALAQLAVAVRGGYIPSSPWESVLVGTLLAELTIDAEGPLPVSAQSDEAVVRAALPAESELADTLVNTLQGHRLDSRDSTANCIDQVLVVCFAHAGEHLDLETDLVHREPNIEWFDKWPTWLQGLTPRQKCEVGCALAKTGIGSKAFIQLQESDQGVLAQFSLDGNKWDEPHALSFSRFRPPGPPGYRPKTVMEINEESRRRQMQVFDSMISPQPPGHRAYSTGLARFITQVRMEELLEGEHPYAYALNNPVTYVDPSGLSPACPQQGDPTQGWIEGMNRWVKSWFEDHLTPKPFNPFPCPPDMENRCRKFCDSENENFVDCTVVGEGLGQWVVNCNCEACPPFKNLPFCSAATAGHIIRPGHGNHNFPGPIGTLKHNCLDKIVNSTGTVMPHRGIGKSPCKYVGNCFGKSVIVTVGFGGKGPCISDAYFAK